MTKLKVRSLWLLIVSWMAVTSLPESSALAGEEASGTVIFRNLSSRECVPETYWLDDHVFPYSQRLRREINGVELWDLRFPSPVTSPYPENNTVVSEYYRPKGSGPFPAVIVLDILGGDQTLGRLQANLFAQNQIAALFVQMAYYGPRRPAGSRVRLVSPDLDHSLAAVRQTVLDVRRAAAWLASQPEVDGGRLGIVGTSLGSFIGSLAAEMEPRLRRVAIVLGGGGLVEAFYDHPKAAPMRLLYELFGGSKERLAKELAIVDPLTRAANLRDRRVLMIAASRDEVVPPSATRRLWQALGEPKIVWYDATHTGAAAYLMPALREVIAHLKAP